MIHYKETHIPFKGHKQKCADEVGVQDACSLVRESNKDEYIGR